MGSQSFQKAVSKFANEEIRYIKKIKTRSEKLISAYMTYDAIIEGHSEGLKRMTKSREEKLELYNHEIEDNKMYMESPAPFLSRLNLFSPLSLEEKRSDNPIQNRF